MAPWRESPGAAGASRHRGAARPVSRRPQSGASPGRRSAGRPRPRRQTGWARDEGAGARVAAAHLLSRHPRNHRPSPMRASRTNSGASPAQPAGASASTPNARSGLTSPSTPAGAKRRGGRRCLRARRPSPRSSTQWPPPARPRRCAATLRDSPSRTARSGARRRSRRPRCALRSGTCTGERAADRARRRRSPGRFAVACPMSRAGGSSTTATARCSQSPTMRCCAAPSSSPCKLRIWWRRCGEAPHIWCVARRPTARAGATWCTSPETPWRW